MRGKTGPVAINSKLGWVQFGPVTTDKTDDTVSAAMTVHTLHVDAITEWLEDTLRSFWELESFGVEPMKDKTYDHSVHMIEIKQGCYEISLLWKEFHPPLPDNYDLSLQRLKRLLHSLRRDPQILEEYCTII